VCVCVFVGGWLSYADEKKRVVVCVCVCVCVCKCVLLSHVHEKQRVTHTRTVICTTIHMCMDWCCAERASM